MNKNNYIFVTGAPGSRWSGYVEDHIYTRNDIDTSDQTPEREYKIDGKILHRGAYFDPLMEFENEPSVWDKPFTKRGGSTGYPRSMGTGIRVIKSHTHPYILDYLTQYKCPIHIVIRPDDECFDWWKEAGGWDITYPDYRHYKNDKVMKSQIALQNKFSMEFIEKHGLEKHNDGKRDYYIWMPTQENG